MSGLLQKLASDLPERYAPTKTSFACDGKSLRDWVTQLPFANPGATARLLIGALREMNQLRSMRSNAWMHWNFCEGLSTRLSLP